MLGVNLKDSSATQESARWTEECGDGVCLLFVSFSSAELVYGSLGIEYGLKIILESLWIGNNVINKIDKRCYQLTFRLVLATCWLRNLLHGNVCSTNVAIGIGNADDARDANNVCLCPYSDLWASCHMYLCRDMEILGLLYKIGSFRIFIYLYRGKIRSLWLSCEQASFFLAFPKQIMYFGLFCFKRLSFGQNKS